MQLKKSSKEYYLLLTEGTTEFNIFAYLTKVKFRELFASTRIQFSPKVEIAELEISNGKLNGVKDLKTFKQKYERVRKKYKEQRRFFLLDRDIVDSSEIEELINKYNDVVQFMELNSEHLLLKIAGKNPKDLNYFNNLTDFRYYCKDEFRKHFKMKASQLKDEDLDKIFKNR